MFGRLAGRVQVVPTAAVLFFFRSIPRTALRCTCKCFANEVRVPNVKSLCNPLRFIIISESPVRRPLQTSRGSDESFPPKHPLLLDHHKLALESSLFTNMDRCALVSRWLSVVCYPLKECAVQISVARASIAPA